MSNRLLSLVTGCILATLSASEVASAAPNLYTARSTFSSVTTGNSVVDLNTLGNSFYGSPGNIILPGLGVQTTSPLFSQANNVFGTGSFLSAQQASPITVTFNLNSSVTAFGFDFSSGTSLAIWVNGVTLTRSSSPFPTLGFVGVADTSPFNRVTVTIFGNGIDIDNITFGSITPAAVPEPASWAMLLSGFFGLGYFMRGSPKVVTRAIGDMRRRSVRYRPAG